MISDAMEKKIQTLPAILSVKEVADFFAVSRRTINRQRKDFSAYKDDEGEWCILRQDVKRYFSRNCNL